MFTRYIEDFLTKEECQSIIKLGESVGLERMNSSLLVNGKLVRENIEYKENKRMGGYFINETLEVPLLKYLSNKIIDLSNQINPYKGITYKDVKKYSFNRYSAGDFLGWHSDDHEVLGGATITYIIQLNEDYGEGEIMYNLNDIEYKVNKKEGSLFIFDSNIKHSVNQVTHGERFSLNVWPTKISQKTLI